MEEGQLQSRRALASLPATPSVSASTVDTPASASQLHPSLPDDVSALKSQVEELNAKLRKYATAIKQMKAEKESHLQELVAANNRTASLHSEHQAQLEQVCVSQPADVCAVPVII
jgi:hypothetical protein